MPAPNNKPINLDISEIAKLLCPKCQEKLKKLIIDKIADRILQQ